MRDSPAPEFARYSAIPLRRVFSEPGEPGHWRILVVWVAALVATVGLGIGLIELGWQGLSVSIGGINGTLVLYPPMLFFGLIALWFGFWWGYVGAVVGAAVLLTYNGVPFSWALVVGSLEALGILTMTLSFRVMPLTISLRTPFSWLFYVLISLLASLTAAISAPFYTTALGMELAESLPIWHGRWVGPFVQWLFITGPVLALSGEWVRRWRASYGLSGKWEMPSRRLMAAALALGTGTLALSNLGNRVIARSQLNALLRQVEDSTWVYTPDWVADVDGVVYGNQLAPFFSIALMVCIALVAFQLAVNWNRTTAEQQAALRASEARTRALFDAIPDLVLHMRADGTVLDHKDGLGLLGPSDLTGRSITDFWPSRITHPLLGRAEDALAKGSSVVEFRMDSDRGLRDFEARLVATGRTDVVAIVRDVTRQRSVVRNNNETITALARDLRAPLTSVRGALGLIRGGVAGDVSPKVSQLVDVAHTNAERMVRLSESLIAAETADPTGMHFKMEQVDLARLVEACVYETRRAAEDLQVHVEVSATVPEARVKVDPDRVVDVIHILLDNALKFAPTRGRVQVSVRRSRDIFRVEVRDDGHGIPEAFQPRVFRRDGSQGAEDRGLALARNIVLHLNGRIGFESKLGRGTTFWFELPEHAEDRPTRGGTRRISTVSAAVN
ncbi:MAG: hypothetical protein H6739_41000 [Alphaproteobacteria bacterium]|nr:hypothetical protein [Alphaproteobacteria bacterium]